MTPIDELTGLPSRRTLLEGLRRDAAASSRLHVLVVDIDRFSDLNRAIGHEGGDAVLWEVARRLSETIGDRGQVSRLGSDEFAIVVEGVPRAVARELIDSLARTYVAFDGVALAISVSVGSATYPDDADDVDAVVVAAGRAASRARSRGTGYEQYDARHEAGGGHHAALAAELRRALEHDELELYFQPQVDVASGRTVGLEGLMRWHHPERGLLVPAAFLPVASTSTLMRPLTLAALDQALEHARRLRESRTPMPVAVNLSPLSLLDLQIAHDVAAALARHDVPASALKLELTEDTLMIDPERAVGVLAGLRAMGVAIAIDDFGTGHSSLAYLRRLPVDEVKIDRAFVSSLPSRASDEGIVRAVIELARGLGLTVVAEGVETEPALARLAELGCDAAQGYHVAHPLAPDRAVDWVAAAGRR